MSEEQRQVWLGQALDRVRSAIPALNEFHGYAHGVAMTDIRVIVEAFDALRAELTAARTVEDGEVAKAVDVLASFGFGPGETEASTSLGRVADLLTRLSAAKAEAERERNEIHADFTELESEGLRLQGLWLADIAKAERERDSARADALEEAAIVADAYSEHLMTNKGIDAARRIAQDIRTLKPTPDR